MYCVLYYSIKSIVLCELASIVNVFCSRTTCCVWRKLWWHSSGRRAIAWPSSLPMESNRKAYMSCVNYEMQKHSKQVNYTQHPCSKVLNVLWEEIVAVDKLCCSLFNECKGSRAFFGGRMRDAWFVVRRVYNLSVLLSGLWICWIEGSPSSCSTNWCSVSGCSPSRVMSSRRWRSKHSGCYSMNQYHILPYPSSVLPYPKICWCVFEYYCNL